jgi:hypothetical protein
MTGEREKLPGWNGTVQFSFAIARFKKTDPKVSRLTLTMGTMGLPKIRN